jgi:hypothetical protein
MSAWPAVRCAGCKWWEGRHDLAHHMGDRQEPPPLGFCRVNPPRTDAKGYSKGFSWPISCHTDWCGWGEGRPADVVLNTLPDLPP